MKSKTLFLSDIYLILHTNKAKSQNKSNFFLIFLIVAPCQQLVVVPGATIRDNMVLI